MYVYVISKLLVLDLTSRVVQRVGNTVIDSELSASFDVLKAQCKVLVAIPQTW